MSTLSSLRSQNPPISDDAPGLFWLTYRRRKIATLATWSSSIANAEPAFGRSFFIGALTKFVRATPRISDAKVIDFFSRFKLCFQPKRLLSSAGPSLCRLGRIPVLRNNLRVRTPLSRRVAVRKTAGLKLSQSVLKLSFFGSYPARKHSCDFQMNSPQLTERDRVKIVGFSFFHVPKNWCQPPAREPLIWVDCSLFNSKSFRK